MEINRKNFGFNRILNVKEIIENSCVFDMEQADIDADRIIKGEHLEEMEGMSVLAKYGEPNEGEKYCYLKAGERIGDNPSHEENVDTSIEKNPTVDDTFVEGVKVWSIFKRERNALEHGFPLDGNPLEYALKNEKGWTFRSDDDRIAIEKQFDAIATKFASLYPIGVTIIIPSGNDLNRHVADVVMSKSENAKLVEGVICKLTTEEVYDIATAKGSYFREYYKEGYNVACQNLELYLGDMNEKRKGAFSRHFVKDNEMRDVLLNTLKVSPDKYAKASSIINDQDILIIDDVISRGKSIKEACKIMMESYAPKSITVLTLFMI